MKLSYITIVAVLAGVLIAPVLSAQQKLSLQDAVALAVDHNRDLQATNLEAEKARQGKIAARSLYLPSVYASAQANHYFQLTPFFGFGDPDPEGKIPYGRFGGDDQLAAFVSAVQPLYNPVAIPTIHQARLQEDDSRLQIAAARTATIALVKQTYLQVLVLNERIKVQQQSIIRNERVLQDSRSLLIQGKGLRVDTLRAYTSVKNLEPELLKLTYAAETRKLELKALTGLDSLQDVELTDSLILPAPGTIPDEETVYNAARHQNPDIQRVALQERISEQQVGIASSARLPHVSAVAQYQVQSQTNSFDYGNAYYPSSSYVGLQVSVPLFTGFNNQAKVRQAAVGREQSALRSQYTYEQLRATVHQVVSENRESLVRLQTTATVKETAETSYTIVKYRYQRGISPRLELTDAELALFTAQSNYLEAVYDYLSARIALLKIMGQE
jgi:outer membrane protein TolC